MHLEFDDSLDKFKSESLDPDLLSKNNNQFKIKNRIENYLRDRHVDTTPVEKPKTVERKRRSTSRIYKGIQTTKARLSKYKLPHLYTEMMNKKSKTLPTSATKASVADNSLINSKEEIMMNRINRAQRIITSNYFKKSGKDLTDSDVLRMQTSYSTKTEGVDDRFIKEEIHKQIKKKGLKLKGKDDNPQKTFQEMLKKLVEAKLKRSTEDGTQEHTSRKNRSAYISQKELNDVENKIRLQIELDGLRERLLDDFSYVIENKNTSIKMKNNIDGLSCEPNLEILEEIKLDSLNESFRHHLRLCEVIHNENCDPIAKRWFKEGIEAYQQRNIFKSINCFKQAVLQDSFEYHSIYNLGCLYEIVQDFELAFKWFYIAKTIHPEDSEINFALSMCYYKRKEYTVALEYLERYCFEVNEEEGEIIPKSLLGMNSTLNYMYLRAICYKGNHNFELSEKIYNQFSKMYIKIVID